MIHKEDCCCPCCQIPRLEKTIAEQGEQIGELQQEIATRNDTMNATVEELMSAKDEIQRLKEDRLELLRIKHQMKYILEYYTVHADIRKILEGYIKAAPPQKGQDNE